MKKSKTKKIIASLLSCSMMFCVGISAFAESFSDVPESSWSYKSIERCKASQWLDGYPDGTFRPQGKLTRAEAIKVFVMFLGLPLSDVTSSTYYDVDVGEWYAPYIEAGKELFPKRTALNGQEKFQPDMPITREDTVYALVKALGYDSKAKFADESVLNMFNDKNSISSNIKQYFAVAVSNGLVSGFKEDSTIRAQDPLTREQFATLLCRGTTIGTITPSDSKAVVSSVKINPETSKELKINESFEITATATYSDKSTADISSSANPYSDKDDGVVEVNKNKVTARKAGTAIIKFNNENMKNISLVVVVSAHDDAPELTVDSVSKSTDKEKITISGTVTDTTGTEITLTINEEEIDLSKKGIFEEEFELNVGENKFVISAKNAYGNETKQTVNVKRKEAATTVVTPTADDDTEESE